MLNVAYPPSMDDSESLFISSPQIESSHIFGPRTSSIDRLSFSPKHSSSGGKLTVGDIYFSRFQRFQ